MELPPPIPPPRGPEQNPRSEPPIADGSSVPPDLPQPIPGGEVQGSGENQPPEDTLVLSGIRKAIAEAKSTVKEKIGETKIALVDSAVNQKERAKIVGNDYKDRVANTAEAAKDKIAASAHAVKDKAQETAAAAGSAMVNASEDRINSRSQITKSVAESTGTTHGVSRRERRLMERRARKRDKKIGAVIERDTAEGLHQMKGGNTFENNSSGLSVGRSRRHIAAQGRKIERVDEENRRIIAGEDLKGRALGGVAGIGRKLGGSVRPEGPKTLDTLGRVPRTRPEDINAQRYQAFSIAPGDRHRFDATRKIRLDHLTSEAEEQARLAGRGSLSDAERQRIDLQASTDAKNILENEAEAKDMGRTNAELVRQAQAEAQRIFEEKLHVARLELMKTHPTASDIPEVQKQIIMGEAKKEAEKNIYQT